MRPLKSGQKAPAFSLQDQDGKTHTIEMYHGRTVLLYFYPLDGFHFRRIFFGRPGGFGINR